MIEAAGAAKRTTPGPPRHSVPLHEGADDVGGGMLTVVVVSGGTVSRRPPHTGSLKLSGIIAVQRLNKQ